MSENEKKYGKVLTVRLKPENSWVVDMLEEDVKKTHEGKPIVSGKSAFIELLLVNYYLERLEKRKQKEASA